MCVPCHKSHWAHRQSTKRKYANPRQIAQSTSFAATNDIALSAHYQAIIRQRSEYTVSWIELFTDAKYCLFLTVLFNWSINIINHVFVYTFYRGYLVTFYVIDFRFKCRSARNVLYYSSSSFFSYCICMGIVLWRRLEAAILACTSLAFMYLDLMQRFYGQIHRTYKK